MRQISKLLLLSSGRPNPYPKELQCGEDIEAKSLVDYKVSKRMCPETQHTWKGRNNKRLHHMFYRHSHLHNAQRKRHPFSNSLADQLKIRLEERRKNTDDSDIQNLAADVQKAVNIANESSK